MLVWKISSVEAANLFSKSPDQLSAWSHNPDSKRAASRTYVSDARRPV